MASDAPVRVSGFGRLAVRECARSTMISTASSVRPNTIMAALGGNHKIPRIGRRVT